MKLSQLFIITLLLSIVTLSACVYRQDIPQGNRVDIDKLEQLTTGMTRNQVEFLLGAPAIIDPFHPDDWQYIYFIKPGDTGDIEKRIMTLTFDQNILTSIDGSIADPESPEL